MLTELAVSYSASNPQVEDFWALYNHIELASRLAAGCDYSLFKEGVKPMWEDERFADRGEGEGEQSGSSNISFQEQERRSVADQS